MVQQPSQSIEKNSTKNTNTQKSTKNKNKTQTSQTTTQTKQTSNLESDWRSSPETSEEGEVDNIVSTQVLVWQETRQKKTHKHKHHIAICRVSEAAQHCAETRNPPSQDPRDHIEQAIRHDLVEQSEEVPLINSSWPGERGLCTSEPPQSTSSTRLSVEPGNGARKGVLRKCSTLRD